MLSGTFEYIEEDEAAKYLDEMDMKKAITIISELETDSAVSILSELPREKRRHIIDLLDNDVKRQIELTASFDEDEIGSKMTANYVSIPDNYTVKQAMSSLIEQAAKNDNISTIFVTGNNNTFYGAIDLKDLIIARKEEPLENLISTSFPYVYANESIDSCLEKLKEYSENIIPVLDNGNHILGVITLQSIIEVFDDELGEDYVRFAGLAAEEDLKEPLKESMKKRKIIALLSSAIAIAGIGPFLVLSAGDQFSSAFDGTTPEVEEDSISAVTFNSSKISIGWLYGIETGISLFFTTPEYSGSA